MSTGKFIGLTLAIGAASVVAFVVIAIVFGDHTSSPPVTSSFQELDQLKGQWKREDEEWHKKQSVSAPTRVQVGTDNDQDTQQKTTSDSAPYESPTPDERLLRVKLLQEFKLGDYSYKVTDVHVTKAVGSEFRREKASEDAVYVLVGFLIRNDGRKTQETDANDFRLLDSQGREFSPDSRATLSVSQEFILRELHPGIFKKGVVVFEVPEEVIKSNVKIMIPEKGIFREERRTAILSLAWHRAEKRLPDPKPSARESNK